MRIDRPIFFLGPGRSGSTLLNNLITHHRDIGYFISWSSKHPSLPYLAVGAWLRSSWLEKQNSRIKYYPAPTEPFLLWKHCFPRFWQICGEPCRDKVGEAKLRRLISTHLKLQRKSRFLGKLTGAPMFEFLQSMFPDAYFVWIDRDPRAVSYSYFLRRRIDLPSEMSDEEKENERLRHAARSYLRLYELLQTKEREYHTLFYEDFIAHPVSQMKTLLSYLDLPKDRRLLDLVAEWPVRKDANRAWQQRLDPGQKELLEGILARPLRERGYM